MASPSHPASIARRFADDGVRAGHHHAEDRRQPRQAISLGVFESGLREVALDGGFAPGSVAEHLPASDRTFIAGRQSAGSRRTDRRLARYRVGAEGRISHLKRRYGLARTRLKGHDGARTWTAWGILAHNLDTLAIRTA